jgi:hypothetical protein
VRSVRCRHSRRAQAATTSSPEYVHPGACRPNTPGAAPQHRRAACKTTCASMYPAMCHRGSAPSAAQGLVRQTFCNTMCNTTLLQLESRKSQTNDQHACNVYKHSSTACTYQCHRVLQAVLTWCCPTCSPAGCADGVLSCMHACSPLVAQAHQSCRLC